MHAKFTALDLDTRHRVSATGTPESVRDAIMSAFRAGRLLVTAHSSTPEQDAT